MPDPTVGLLRRAVHAMPVSDYAAELRERLPDTEVRVAATPSEERAVLADCDVVSGTVLDAGDLPADGGPDLFACTYAGVDHLPLGELAERGVAVTNAAGVHGPNVAEYAVGALLAEVRGFRAARRQTDRREWRHFPTAELHGDTVAVVGMGAIGTAVCERLAPFGVERIGVRYSPEKGGPAEEVVGLRDDDALQAALARTDHLVLACPLTDTTRGLVDAEALATLPPGATLVNVARGPVVDTDALVDALRAGGVGGAWLDVTDPEPLPADHPLWTFENVTVTPHNAGHTPAYYERLADIVAENVRRVRESGRYENLRNQVDIADGD
jgi:phosphoglycerate dehydrogenase-like enzyme